MAEGGEGSDPDLLDELAAVLLAEFLEGQRQILQVGVDALDLFPAGSHGKAVVTALGNAAVTVDVIALILGLQQFAELGQLLLHLQQPGVADDVAQGSGKGLNDLAVGVLVVAVELGAVVGDAAELLHIVHGVVRGHAHDGAHLIALAVVVGGPALAAHSVRLLKDGVVGIALLLQIHARSQARRAAADDADTHILVHVSLQKN